MWLCHLPQWQHHQSSHKMAIIHHIGKNRSAIITSSWFFTATVTITSVTTNKKKLAIASANIETYWYLYQKVGTIMANKYANNIIKHIIPHTPSKVGVLQSITFSHIPDEARSVVLAKPCVPSKNLFCYREISFNNISYTE